MSSESKALFEFKKKLRELKDYSGRGTELISVYLTPGYPIHEMAAKLRDEYGQAGNIKSKSTQKNVQAAIEKILAFLKTFKKTPDNGIAIFCGNTSQIEGQVDVGLFYVVPPAPLATQFYRCESRFVLEPLEELLENTGTYGLVVLDGKDATIALLKGKQVKVLRHLHSTAQAKQHHGGQCIHAEELVPFADGRIAPISTVKVGDLLIGVDLKTGKPKPSEVTTVFRRTTSLAFSLLVENPFRKINVTPEHRFFVVTARGIVEKTASELINGDNLLYVNPAIETAENGTILLGGQCIPNKLVKKEEITPGKDDLYYDLTLPETQNFVVNGFVVHNSAARFQRIHEETTEKYYQRIGEAMAVFLEQKNFQGVIVGGPGPTKEDFLKLKAYNYQLKILGVLDIGYADEYGLREVVEKAGDILKEQEAFKERKLVADFISRISKSGLAVYGLDEAQKAVDSRRADKLLVTEDMELYDCEYKCDGCGKIVSKSTEEKIESEPCECGRHRKPGLCRLRVTDLVEQAETQGIVVEYISLETDEGKQFHASFKGVGALLRY